MKRSLLVPLLSVLVASLCFAQNQTLPQKIAHLYAPLDKSQCGTGYFFDLCVPLAEPLEYRGTLNDSNYTDINVFGMLYGEILSIPPKNPFFTFKTQHRRTQPQPSP